MLSSQVRSDSSFKCSRCELAHCEARYALLILQASK